MSILQDYIEDVQKHASDVRVFLKNGLKLTGVITDYDDHGMILVRDNKDMVIRLEAVATIQDATQGSDEHE